MTLWDQNEGFFRQQPSRHLLLSVLLVDVLALLITLTCLELARFFLWRMAARGI